MRCTCTKNYKLWPCNSLANIQWHSPPLVLLAEPQYWERGLSLDSWPPGIGAAAHCLRVQESV